MTIKDRETVTTYVDRRHQTLAALENLTEFFENLPAPQDDDTIANIHYGHIGSINEIHRLLGEAMRVADEVFA